MKKVMVETKHGGKVVVPIYETLEDAVKALSKERVLKDLNRMIRIDIVNEANRRMSITAKLKRAVKDGKILESDLLAFLSKVEA